MAAVPASMARPDSRNQKATPTCSARGLLTSRPTGMAAEEIRVSTEKARPICSAGTVSWR